MQIGNFVALVMEVDVQEDGAGWENSLQVKVVVDLNKPITRGKKN